MQITKDCADSLRSFAKNHFGVELKSSHAHELVAAYMGYSSRAALLADIKCPVTNLAQAEFIVLQPTAFIKARCKELNGLPEELLDGVTEGVYSPMLVEKWFLHKIYPTLEFLALTLANESIVSRGSFFKDQKIQREGVKVEPYEDGIYLRVLREYVSPSRVLSNRQGILAVVDLFKLKSVAGNIGYVKSNHYWTEAETLDAAIEKMESGSQRSLSDNKPTQEIQIFKKSELNFTGWLAKQKNRNSPLGDLSKEMLKDDKWPSFDSIEEYQDYFRTANFRRGASAALSEAWKSYKRHLKQQTSPRTRNLNIKKTVKQKTNYPKIVFIKNVIPIHFTKRTVETFTPGDLAWISWDGRKAIPVTILEVDDRHYTFRVERPLKKAGDQLFLLLEEVRSTPELACANHA